MQDYSSELTNLLGLIASLNDGSGWSVMGLTFLFSFIEDNSR